MSKRIIVAADDEHHEFVQFPIYGDRWEKALACLSGDGAETQLINALDKLGFAIYTKEDVGG